MRLCADCGDDISGRPNAKRCKDCARKAKQASRLESRARLSALKPPDAPWRCATPGCLQGRESTVGRRDSSSGRIPQWCEPCAKRRKLQRSLAWKHRRRVCLDCPATIPASKPGNTLRCRACSEAALRERHQLQRRRPVISADRRKLKPTAPPLADHDMTPARVVTVDGEQFEVAWAGGAGLSSVGARGSMLIEGRGAVRRNGSIILGGGL